MNAEAKRKLSLEIAELSDRISGSLFDAADRPVLSDDIDFGIAKLKRTLNRALVLWRTET